MKIDGSSIQRGEWSTEIEWPTPQDASDFAKAFSRATLKGHSVGGVTVTLDGLTEGDRAWIDAYASDFNSKQREEAQGMTDSELLAALLG